MSDTQNEHEWFAEQVATYLAGGLNPAERARLETHANECPSCGDELKQMSHLEADMSALFAEVNPNSDFEQRVIDRLRLNLEARRWRIPAHPMVRKAAIAAAAAVIVASVGSIGKQLLDPNRPMLAFGFHEWPMRSTAGSGPAAASMSAKFNDDGYQASESDALAAKASRSNAASVDMKVAYADTRTLNAGSFNGVTGGVSASGRGRGGGGGGRGGGLSTGNAPVSLAESSTPPVTSLNGGTLTLNARDTKDNLANLNPNYYKPNDPGQRPTITAGFRNGFSLLHAQDVSDAEKRPDQYAATYKGPEAQDQSGQTKDESKSTVFAAAQLEPGAAQPAPAAPAAQAAVSSTTPTTQPIVQHVIREGSMEFEVDSFDSTFTQIGKIVIEEGGFVASADSDKLPNGKVKGLVTVRVPPDHLDTLVLKLRALGELKSQRLGSRDVGKEYTDLEGELRADRAMESRLLEMIKSAQGNVAQLLQAERELGTWRTKIEKIVGELNYYNNLISMAALQISAYEKDIKTPATSNQTEEINTGLETEDVEGSRTAMTKTIDDVKGRIIESSMQKLEAGQFAARIIAEVPPENAGQVVDRLRQLGRVARMDAQTKQTQSPGSGGSQIAQPKLVQSPTRLIISMYNLSNIAPRLTNNLSLAGEDVEATYRAILKRVEDANGRVISSNLNRQDATQVSGSIQFEVKSAEADAVLNDLRKNVQVLRLSVNENPDTANITTAKQAFAVQMIPMSQVSPRETRTMSLQVGEVEPAIQDVTAAVKNAGGKVIESNVSQDAGGKSTAALTIELPLDKTEQLADAVHKLGKVRLANAKKNSQVPEGPLARARVNLTIANADTIVSDGHGFWDSIRGGLSTSVAGLLTSVQLMVIGLCLIGPWALLLWGGWKFLRRSRRIAS